MPFYEYECSSCGRHEEVLQQISDKPLKKCPSCGKNTLTKLMSAPVFRLKGSGWYETDFKSDKENKRNLVGADKDEPKPDTKSDAKADTKADTKVDNKSEPAKTEGAKPDGMKSAPTKPARSAPAKASRPRPKSPASRKPRKSRR